jgi:hypothetical protein
MDDGTIVEIFETEAAAIAFTDGLEYSEGDHLTYDPPFENASGEWVVELRLA